MASFRDEFNEFIPSNMLWDVLFYVAVLIVVETKCFNSFFTIVFNKFKYFAILDSNGIQNKLILWNSCYPSILENFAFFFCA
jgi:ABC-type lipoprotein release transport system permease subunit